MYIVIAGGGVAGSTVAGDLVDRKHDVVVIERNAEACETLFAKTGAVVIRGSATEMATLREAGIEKADVAIGALYRDADNLMFALLARSAGVPKIIVKMRDPSYEDAFRVAGANGICNMIELLRRRVEAELEAPRLELVTELASGARLASFQIPQEWKPEGVCVRELVEHPPFARDCVVVGIVDARSGRLALPRGKDRIRAGDRVFVAGTAKTLARISRWIAGRSNGAPAP